MQMRQATVAPTVLVDYSQHNEMEFPFSAARWLFYLEEGEGSELCWET
jgi:hypothetical protein